MVLDIGQCLQHRRQQSANASNSNLQQNATGILNIGLDNRHRAGLP